MILRVRRRRQMRRVERGAFIASDRTIDRWASGLIVLPPPGSTRRLPSASMTLPMQTGRDRGRITASDASLGVVMAGAMVPGAAPQAVDGAPTRAESNPNQCHGNVSLSGILLAISVSSKKTAPIASSAQIKNRTLCRPRQIEIGLHPPTHAMTWRGRCAVPEPFDHCASNAVVVDGGSAPALRVLTGIGGGKR